MADYRNIHTRIWADSWFSELASDEKLTFFYLFSNPNASVSGLYEIPKRTIALDTGIEMSRLNEILDVFANAGKVFYQDGVVWVVNLRKYNDSGDSIKIRSCIQKDLEKIKDCELKTRYMDDLQIPYPEPQIPYPEKKSETKRNETKRNETKRDETQSAPDSRFDEIQEIIEAVTGLPADPGSVKTILELDQMGAIREDIQAGDDWLRENKKTVKYYGQLIGPTRTAIARRIGEAHSPPPKKVRYKIYTNADGVRVNDQGQRLDENGYLLDGEI